MPDLDDFTLAELRAIARYLELDFHPKSSRASIEALIYLFEISNHECDSQESELGSDHEMEKIYVDCPCCATSNL